MKFNHARMLIAASLLPLSTLWLLAQDTNTSGAPEPTGEQAAKAEIAQRHQLLISATQSIDDGERFLGSGKFDEAADRFQYALDALTNGGISESLYNRAEAGLAAAKAGQAQADAKDTNFAEAAGLLEQAINLQPNDPTYPRDLQELKKQQMAYEAQVRDPEGTTNNPVLTEDFKDRVAVVQKLLFQGDDYFKTGQYAKAEETYSKILILDPYNKAARDKMDHMEKYMDRASHIRHDQYEQEGYMNLDLTWQDAVSPDIVIPAGTSPTIGHSSNRAEITKKLQSIVIDKVNFDKLDIATVIAFLQKKSKELDPDHLGINFVLRLTSDTPPPSDNPATPATPTGTTAPTFGGGTSTPTAPVEAPAQREIHRSVSITLSDVPLAEVLRYITEQTNLQYTVEDYAVYLRPSIDEGETLTVRTYLIPANFFSGSSLSVNTNNYGDNNGATTVSSVVVDVQSELTSRGIRFPEGATATFLPGSSKLVVRDTPEQLDLIANLIDQLNQEAPQIEIESKLAEFNQDAIKGVTFNYFINSPVPPGNVFTVSTALRNTNYLGGTDSNGGLEANSINTLIQQNVTENSTGGSSSTFPLTGTTVLPSVPNTLTVGGMLNSTGLEAVMDAINNMTGVSLLAAPSVTTQNGLRADIEIVREFPYPSSFDRPQLTQGLVDYSSGPGANQNLSMAVPPTPREFVTQNIGVSLEVRPTTYPDQRIDLDITRCQVVDFDGFINYGQGIYELAQGTIDNQPPAQQLTPGVINMPVFEQRSVVTRLQVLDGQTAVLGGLIREDTQEVHDKIPFLGDLPIFGRLFQSKFTERTKKNLIIFITARLVRSNGKPQYVKTLDAEPAEEVLPEPPPLGTGSLLPSSSSSAGAEGIPGS
jgi:general secretion pathway protein D